MAKEKRLIDANEALRMIKDSQEDNPFLNIRGQGEIWRGAHDNSIDCVNTCPTVDAVEVVHGRWVLHQEDGYEWYECSSCRAQPLNDNAERPVLSDYCPNCGAKMDGDGK